MLEYALGILRLTESPERRKAREQREKENFEKFCVPMAVPWDEDKTKFDMRLIIDGKTYKPAPLFECPPTRIEVSTGNYKFSMIDPAHMFEYANVIIPRGVYLQLMSGRSRGLVAFTTDVTIPTLRVGKANPDWRSYENNVWMSLTPMEVITQRPGIRRATGKVMLGGLGLGWLMRKILAKKSVKEMVVVEQSEALLDWYGNRICTAAAAEFNKPVKVICGDALQHMGKHGKDTRHIVDIWSSYPTDRLDLKRTGWLDAIEKVRYFWGWGCTLSENY